MTNPAFLPLEPYLNQFAATGDDARSRGRFNAWGNSFPAEEVPFGKVWTVAAMDFQMPVYRDRQPDHVEAAGQFIPLPVPADLQGLAILCCGEMGDQALSLTLHSKRGPALAAECHAGGWLVDPSRPVDASCLMFTHLHYPGDYELSHLCPALWAMAVDLPEPFPLTGITLGTNPLFHIFAITLSMGDRGHVQPERD